MNILITVGVAASALCVLWAVKSLALKLAGEPLAWPLRFTTRKPLVRWTARIMVHTSWLIILVGTPLALGIHPLDALNQAFQFLGVTSRSFSRSCFFHRLAYVLLVKAGWVHIEPQHDQATRRGKLLRRFLGPLPLATLEEAVFRGTLLQQLLRSFPQTRAYAALAIVLSSVVFSAVHFIKRHPGKPVWQPAYGLFIVGCLFGLAYVVGGRSLWLPIVMHATAVFVIEIMKLYVVHRAPRWLMGYAEWPQSGLVGSIFVLWAAIALVLVV